MIIIPIVIIFGIIFVSFTTDSPKKGENSMVFHVTLADPSLYGDDGVYTEKINVVRAYTNLDLFQMEAVQKFYR